MTAVRTLPTPSPASVDRPLAPRLIGVGIHDVVHDRATIEWAVGEVRGVRRGNVVAFSVGVEHDGRMLDGGADEQLVVCVEAHSADAAVKTRG